MSPSVGTIIAASASAGIVAGWFLRTFFRSAPIRGVIRSRTSSLASSDVEESDEEISFANDGEYKMVIVIRNDLKMGKGKIAAQSCHAACSVVKKLAKRDPDLLYQWEWCGQPKIVTKVDSEEALLELSKHASSIGLPHQVIRDAGRTQIAPGSLTALAVGPAPNELVNQVTGKLKLL